MDNKYGRIFTEEDVKRIVVAAQQKGAPRGMTKVVAGVERSEGLTFPPDEPLFLLRARDSAARTAIANYRLACHQMNASQEHLDGIAESQRLFEAFRANHATRVAD